MMYTLTCFEMVKQMIPEHTNDRSCWFGTLYYLLSYKSRADEHLHVISLIILALSYIFESYNTSR